MLRARGRRSDSPRRCWKGTCPPAVPRPRKSEACDRTDDGTAHVGNREGQHESRQLVTGPNCRHTTCCHLMARPTQGAWMIHLSLTLNAKTIITWGKLSCSSLLLDSQRFSMASDIPWVCWGVTWDGTERCRSGMPWLVEGAWNAPSQKHSTNGGDCCHSTKHATTALHP